MQVLDGSELLGVLIEITLQLNCLVDLIAEKLLKPSDMPARLPPRSGASSPRLCIRAKVQLQTTVYGSNHISFRYIQSMDTDKGTIRVYPGMQRSDCLVVTLNVKSNVLWSVASVDGALKFKTVHATVDTTSEEIIQLALTKMGLKVWNMFVADAFPLDSTVWHMYLYLQHENVSAYSLVQVTLHKGGTGTFVCGVCVVDSCICFLQYVSMCYQEMLTHGDL